MRFTSFCVFSLFLVVLREFCTPSSHLNHGRFHSSSKPPQFTDPRSSPCSASLIGFRALTQAFCISPSFVFLEQTKDNQLFLPYRSVSPFRMLGCPETICPGHFPCYCMHGSSSCGLLGLKHVHHHESAFL